MKLGNDVEILDGLPILYIKSLDAIVCSDLHLGYEGVMAGKGTFMPKANFRHIKEMLTQAVERTKAKTILVDGDIKNEFSEVHLEEFNEFQEFIAFVRGELGVERIILVKGNHDNFIERLKPALKFESHGEEAHVGDYLFFHGDQLPESRAGKLLVMGHLHPAIGVYNRVGVKEKLRCFLYGSYDAKRKIIVLPAMNFFAEGVDVVGEDAGDVSPIFEKHADIRKMRALCVGEGETLDFGRIEQIRAATYG